MMGGPQVRVDEALIDEISASMDLRDPNRLALLTLAGRLGAWQESGAPDGAEFVFDVATGVGKTYVMGAAIDYLAEFGVCNFVIFVPRVAILNKTLNNFTRGHAKSVVDNMLTSPSVITIDDLESPATRSLMDDPDEIKVYVVTVQSFTGRIAADVTRKAHTFQEALGENFYMRLKELDDLVVIADEHHTYYGNAFSDAVRDLEPLVLVGLTGTPHDKTPDEQIVYRYPLANAIADRYVKTPVLVGRSDELADDRTKLYDGVMLLRAKQLAADQYAAVTGRQRRNLLMLVVTQDIAEADKVEGLLTDPTFFDGEYAGKVLRVDSSQPDEALEALDQVEDPDSPYRIIVSVAMLKEGWDVATVSVICSLRASVSDLLTEQTLGRGLRLPWGRYVDDPLLNELDVVAHEQYEKVLRRANVLNERIVDWRTWQAEQQQAAEELAAAAASDEARQRVREQIAALTRYGGPAKAEDAGTGEAGESDRQMVDTAAEEPFTFQVQTIEDRKGQVADHESAVVAPNLALGTVDIPVVSRRQISMQYELSDVLAIARNRFVELGRRFARDPEDALRREAVVARVETGPDGLPRTRVTTAPASTKVASPANLPSLEETRSQMVDAITASDYATGRVQDLAAAQEIVDAVVEGAGTKADTLAAYPRQVTGAVLKAVAGAVNDLTARPTVEQVVERQSINWVRRAADDVSEDLRGAFDPSVAYVGWAKSLYEQVRFHSTPERDFALVVDADGNGVQFWVRLHRNDLPIAWVDGKTRNYNPDFLVVEVPSRAGGKRMRPCWLVEVKSDRNFDDADVVAKHEAAASWAARANADPRSGDERWDVLRVSETHIRDAKGSWKAIKQMGESALS